MGALESALYRPQSGYYDGIIQEAAALMESLAINHPFIDGNKRVAFAAMDVFLRMNNYRLTRQSENIYQFVIGFFEAGQFNMEQLEDWLKKNVVAVDNRG